jgi:magnesium chelatase subunit I
LVSATSDFSSAEKRGIVTGEKRVVPRICDLHHLIASCRGKIEMTLAEEDGSEDKLIQSLTGEAVKAIFGRYAEPADFENISEQFKSNLTFPAGDELSADELTANMKAVKGLHNAALGLSKEMKLDGGDPAILAAVGEFLPGRFVRKQSIGETYVEGQNIFR